MYLTITEDGTGEILEQRKLGDEEHLDPDKYAAAYAEEREQEIDDSDGYVPLGCAHITVELAEEPQTAVCWVSRSYFFKQETPWPC